MSVGGTVLLVSSRPATLALKLSLVLMGAEVHLAEAGLPALTQLERLVPDTIVSDSTLDDMTGRELMDIVRADPQLHTSVFALLGAFDGSGFGLRDLAVPPGLTLARTLRELLPILAQPAPGTRTERVDGDFDTLDLGGVLDALDLGRQTGVLTVEALSSRPELWVRRGELVHAQYGVKRAEEALLALAEGMWCAPGQPFSFEAAVDLPHVTSPIRTPTGDLLRTPA